MKSSYFVYVGVILTLVAGVFATAEASVVADGAQIQKIATNYSFTEGPAVDADGNVFFTDQPNNKILKLTPEGTVSTFLSPCGRANGLYFDRDGYLWACADEHNELWRIDPNGVVTVVVTGYLNKLLNGPNDLWINRHKGLYFTDPFFQRNYWNRGPMEQSGQHVYYLAPDMQTLVQVTNDLQQPNGIIGTPDGKILYVADYGGRKTYRYSIQPDGTLAGKRLFCSQGSDGMTIDEEGNLYLTGSGVAVYNPLGEKIETINVPEGTSNVTFGGPDNKTLYITAQKSLYAIQMRVKGASLVPEFNSDLGIDFTDYTKLAKSWKLDDPNLDLGPGLQGDGIIDMQDVAILANNWLKEVLPLELVAYWKMDEESGSLAHEYINSRNAIIIGDKLWMPDSGKVDGALLFDGVNNYANVPYVFGPEDGSFSIFAWIKGGGPEQAIISQTSFANWISTDIDGKLMVNLAPNSGRPPTDPLFTDVVVTDGSWHQVGLTWDGHKRTVYIDGIEAARDEEAIEIITSHSKLLFGTSYNKAAGTFWSGMIDDVRLYDSVIIPE